MLGGQMEQIAALRAEWFARLSEAIEGAQRLAWQLGTHEGASNDARELYGRLEAARLELDSLKGLVGRPIDRAGPDWLHQLGWSGSLRDPRD